MGRFAANSALREPCSRNHRGAGTLSACRGGVAVRSFKDLIAWQLAHELKCELYAVTATGPAARDFKYRDQVRDSSASAAANIAEGFGRFRPRDFANFLSYAKASLVETQNHLTDGHDRGYLSDPLYWRLTNLARAAERATTNLILSKRRQAPGR